MCRSTIHVLFPGCSYTTSGQHGTQCHLSTVIVSPTTHGGNLTCVSIGRETEMILPYTCVFGSRSCSADTRRISLPWCLPPCVLVSLDSRVDDGLNSRNSSLEFQANSCRDFFGFGPESFFFGPKIPCVAIFYFLCWLVGWLWFDTTFRDVCHPKNITVPLATTAIKVGNKKKRPVETLDPLL